MNNNDILAYRTDFDLIFKKLWFEWFHGTEYTSYVEISVPNFKAWVFYIEFCYRFHRFPVTVADIYPNT